MGAGVAQVGTCLQLQRPVRLAVSRERDDKRARRLGGERRPPRRRLDLAPVLHHVVSLGLGKDGTELGDLVARHAATAIHPQQHPECVRRDDVGSLLGPRPQFADVAGRLSVHGSWRVHQGGALDEVPAALVLDDAEVAVLEGGET